VSKLETRNAQLQETLEKLQIAHEQIIELNRDLDLRVQQRTAALNAANRELEAFSYSVSHDLRAPLRHISGFASILQESSIDRLDDDGRDQLKKILDASRRMDQLIQDLLELSHAGRSQMRGAQLDLEVLLDEALWSLRPDLEGRNIEWQRGRLPKVLGDASLLRQVLINLLSNAVKYSQPRALARIEIGSREAPPGEIVIFVRDNGVGFDMKYAGELFGVFRRLHGADEFEGTGIGLAIAQRIIARHGGRIWAESVVDGGATFFFSLPAPTAG
jgi:light-regulated signal transduction histidine kinase (bacteriophytochrome)